MQLWPKSISFDEAVLWLIKQKVSISLNSDRYLTCKCPSAEVKEGRTAE